MSKQLEVFLYELQDDLNTPEDNLSESNYLQACAEGDNELEIVPQKQQLQFVNGFLSQDSSVMGSMNINSSISLYPSLSTSGANPEWCDFMEASGYSVNTSGSEIVITPEDEVEKAITLWKYTGKNGSDKSMLTKSGNNVFDLSISAETTKAPIISYTGKGTYVDYDKATKPTVNPSRQEQNIPTMIPVSCDFMGENVKLLKMDFQAGNSVQQMIDGNSLYGWSYCEIEDRKSKLNLSFYLQSDYNPLADLIDGSIQTGSITWGPSGKQITFNFKVEVADVKITESNGFYQYDVNCNVIDNEHSFVLDILS